MMDELHPPQDCSLGAAADASDHRTLTTRRGTRSRIPARRARSRHLQHVHEAVTGTHALQSSVTTR